jgi:SAM-dependent methyltransferase
MSEGADRANADFWDELCGTALALQLGIHDRSPRSLRLFDDYYFGCYPYLERHIQFERLRAQSVLEVGLGYGSVSQRLAASGAHYTGLDVAAGPVGVVNDRLRQAGLEGQALLGSILQAPFADQSFDQIIAIGCYHHTGDFAGAISESWRLLKPGGRLCFMVYNAYSYRRWLTQTRATMARWLKEWIGIRPSLASPAERAAYDVDSSGRVAPFTEFMSRRQVRQECCRFVDVKMTLENAAAESLFRHWSRDRLLASPLARWAGLDIYVQAYKA